MTEFRVGDDVMPVREFGSVFAEPNFKVDQTYKITSISPCGKYLRFNDQSFGYGYRKFKAAGGPW